MSETISQLPAATTGNATDLIPATQGSVGPGTGTTRAVTPGQIVGAPFSGTMIFAHATVTDASALSTGYQIEQDITYNLSVGATGIFFGNALNCTVNGNPQSAQIWNNFDRMLAETANTSSSTLVNHYIQSVRPAAFPAPAQTLFGMVIEARDQTGLPSSGGGGLLGLEIDVACNGVDDGTAAERQGLIITFLNGTGSGASPQANSAIGIYSGGDSSANFKSIIQLAVPFLNAAIDGRSTGQVSGGTTHFIWMRTGLDIALDTAGNFTLSTDSTYINASKIINSPNGYAIGGSAQLLSADGSTIASTEPFRVPAYTVAALPVLTSNETGALAFATNACNTGEGSGSGTGCLVCRNNIGVWVSVWSGVAPTT